MTVTVFTAAIGATRDVLRAPTVVNPSVRYVCLSDRASSPRPYQHVPVQTPPSGYRTSDLLARQIKILMDHPALGSPDVMFWHDASFQLRADPETVARDHLRDDDILAFSHPHWSRIEDEAVEIDRRGYVPLELSARQVATYRGEGFTQQSVLTCAGFILRRCTPQVQRFNDLWWAEVQRWGWRDQMSVDYAIWKTGLRVRYIPGHYRVGPFANWYRS